MRSKYEIQAQKELEAEGYFVDNKAGMSRFSKNRDFFNLFDLVAVRKAGPIRYISIKGHAGGYRENLEEIKRFWLPKQGVVKEQWRWPKRKKGNEAWIKKVIR